MTESMEDKEKAAGIFLALAELYKPPSLELWNELEQDQLLEKLQLTARQVYGLNMQSFVQAKPPSFEQYSNMYLNALSDGGKQAAIPVESLYKPWTTDETCKLPFAKSKGYLQGDSALHIRFILDQLEMEIPEEYAGMPDHLSILLELLAYFIEHSPDAFAKEFIADHFDWLEEFEGKLAAGAAHPFYQQVTRFLIDILNAHQSAHMNGAFQMEGGDALSDFKV